MEIPVELRLAVETLSEHARFDELQKDAKQLSMNYRTQSGHGKRLLTEKKEAVAYSAVRMPATYGAVHTALRYALQFVEEPIKSLLDVGAGTGAATWAASELIELDHITCMEREEAMVQIGQHIMEQGSNVLREAQWIPMDLVRDPIAITADLVTASYVLNEMSAETRLQAVDQLWQAADQMLLIIEPGTTEAFQELKVIREHLIKKGAYLVAPCTHEGPCSLPEEDWCHFSCRIPRSRMHRQLKDGDAPYEDEKFTYLAFTKTKAEHAHTRILRHPIVEKGKITLEVCEADGRRTWMIPKKSEYFKAARKLQWGDSL